MRELNHFVCGAPYRLGAPLLKFGVETGAALAIGALVIGTMGSAIAASNANATNQLIANKTNEENWKMLKEQERYNGLPNQRALAEAAGYSPAAVLGNQSTIGVGSAAQAAPAVVPDMSAFNQMASTLYDARRMQSEVTLNEQSAQKQAADAAGQTIDNQYKSSLNIAKIRQLIEEAQLAGSRNTEQMLQNRFRDASFQYDLDNKVLTNRMLEEGINKTIADTNYVTSQKLLADKKFEWFDALNDAELQYTLAKIGTENTMQQRNRAESTKLIADAILAKANTANVQVNTDTANRAADFIVAEQQNAAASEKWNAVLRQREANLRWLDLENYNVDKWFKRGSTIVNGVTGGAIGYGVAKGRPKPQKVKGFNGGGR